MNDDDASLYRDFRDFLHEHDSGEDTLLKWKRERDRKLVLAAIERDRQTRIAAAWAALLARSRAADDRPN